MNKKEIANHLNENGYELPPALSQLKQEMLLPSTPDGYFDTLNSRIHDRINAGKQKTKWEYQFARVRNRLIYIPVTVLAAFLVFKIFMPATNTVKNAPTDEYTQLSMAYDASFAQEVYEEDNQVIDQYLESEDQKPTAHKATIITNNQQLTDEEIMEYLKSEDIDTELLIENSPNK